MSRGKRASNQRVRLNPLHGKIGAPKTLHRRNRNSPITVTRHATNCPALRGQPCVC